MPEQGYSPAPEGRSDKVLVPIPREVIEREVIFDAMALRDERFLRLLTEEDRRRLGDNPVGEIAYLSAEVLGTLGSVTQGCFCVGSPKGFTKGVVCKWLHIPAPPTPPVQAQVEFTGDGG